MPPGRPGGLALISSLVFAGTGFPSVVKKIKISHPWSRWPLQRQSPGGSGIWEDCRFVLQGACAEAEAWLVLEDLGHAASCRVPDGRVILLLYEWHYIKPRYAQGFLAQFDAVHTYRPDQPHPQTVHRWLPLPWFHGVPMVTGHRPGPGAKPLEDYLGAPWPEKKKFLSVISSNKNLCEGHRKRLELVKALEAAFPGQIDVFGSGLREIRDKAEAIDPYRYHVVLENGVNPDGWTEKFADCLLGRAHPFYWGCPNLEKYFPADAFTRIPAEDPAAAVRIIQEAVAADVFSRGLAAREEGRERILHRYNLFPAWRGIAQHLEKQFPSKTGRHRRLRPEDFFSEDARVRWRARIRDWRNRLLSPAAAG